MSCVFGGETMIFLTAPQNYKGEQDAQSSSAIALTDLVSSQQTSSFYLKKPTATITKQNWNQPTKQTPPNPQTSTQPNPKQKTP